MPLPPPDSGNKQTAAVLVALDGDFSKDRRAEIDARQITVQALQTRLGTLCAESGVALKPGSVAAQFAAQKLTPVYLDTPAFRAMAKSLPGQGAGRKTGPLLVDRHGQRIVFDLQRAFVSGDRLSDAAVAALVKALDLPGQGLQTPEWLQPATPRRSLKTAPRYKGHAIPAQNGGAGFYKANDHRLLADKREIVRKQLPEFVHANYFQAESTMALGKDVMVHRGLFDTHAGIPENSLAAIERAYAEGYRTLELDVQVSAEGVPVLLHDFAIGRTTDDPDNRLATQVGYAELQRKRLVIRNPMDGNFVSTEQRIAGIEPVLENVLRTKPGMSVVLDCKEHIAENVALLLIRRPQLRPITALKLYSCAYKGGFDEFFSNMCQKLQINPLHSQDQPRRAKLRRDLSAISVVPLLIEDTLQDTQLRRFFPGAEDAAGLADTATHWMQSWNRMRPIIAEMMIMDRGSDAGKAMQLAQKRLQQPDSGYEKAAFSSAYRYEDFSIPRSGGNRDYFTWGVFGEINPVPRSGFEPLRGTAGAFRDRGESVLTDQPDEEVLALRENRTLPRGHTGLELDVPPDAALDRSRDAAIVQERRQQFMDAKQPPNQAHVEAARRGATLDRNEPPLQDAAARKAIDDDAEALGLLTDRYRGAPVSHYLNEQAKQTEPKE
ncbi:avirulence protein [Xanthomonas hyacinthi DSM 19077]|nr:avirulence protein [Xanthomonas hyacinthi DSM 19077]